MVRYVPWLLLLCGFALCPSIAFGQGTINVEIDYMVETGADAHNHMPTVAEMEAVERMFSCHGWTLNYIIDDAITHYDVLQYSNSDGFFGYSGVNNSWGSLKANNFDNTGGGWHYAIFGHQYEYPGTDGIVRTTGSSGLAEIGGDDLLVSLGSFTAQVGTAWDRASTFAHELGHNLELRHNGGQTGTGNYKPNYASIMSYQYQLRGVQRQLQCLGLIGDTSLYKNLDYSNGRLPSITESALSETTGAGIAQVDWNCSGSVTAGTVSHELDEVRPPWCGKTGDTLSTLSDSNDWAAIVDSPSPDRPNGIETPEVAVCITAEEVEASRREFESIQLQDPSLCPSGQPAVVLETCVDSRMIFMDSFHSGTENGTGDFPYNTLLEAHTAATAGSIIYLQPGTHTTDIPPLLLNKRVTLSSPDSATVSP